MYSPEQQRLPRHIAIIMDGNGRWAYQRGLTRTEGHRAGVEAARNIVSACRERGIEYLTLYAFSRENWKRPREELDLLFDLLLRFLRQEQEKLLEKSIRLNVLGQPEGLPWPVRQLLDRVCRRTAEKEGMFLNLALNYSGREDVLQACRKLFADRDDSADISQQEFSRYLCTSEQPDPDLIIRTSGEKRLSNFLLFQAAYSELYFTDTFWPDYGEKDLDEAIADFLCRKRRFGAVQ